MAATRRLQKELGEIKSSQNKSFRDVQVSKIYFKILQKIKLLCFFQQVDESNLLVWQGLLVPEKAPYNKVVVAIKLKLIST